MSKRGFLETRTREEIAAEERAERQFEAWKTVVDAAVRGTAEAERELARKAQTENATAARQDISAEKYRRIIEAYRDVVARSGPKALKKNLYAETARMLGPQEDGELIPTRTIQRCVLRK